MLFFLAIPVSNPIPSEFSRDRSSLFPPRSPFRRTRPSIRFRLSPSLAPPPSSSPHLLPFRPSFPLAFTPPHFLSHSSPLFHLSPQLTNKRAHPRASRTYAYERTHPPVRRFSFIAFTPSPTSCNSLYFNALGVKENEKRPSHIAQQTHYQQIRYKSPISSTVNPIYRRGELKKPKAFTPYALCHNHLRHTGEGVKAKNENRLTRARTREGKWRAIGNEKERHTQGLIESRVRRSENRIGVSRTTFFNRARTCRWVRLPVHGASCRAHPY